MNRNLFSSKRIFAALLAVGLFTACESEDDLNVTSPVRGIFPSETLEFTATAQDANQHDWYLDGKHIGSESVFKYTFNQVGEYEMKYTGSFDNGTPIESTERVAVNPFEGFLVLAEGTYDLNNSVTFINTERGLELDTIFSTMNEGARLGATLQSAAVHGEYIYAVTQNGPNYISILNRDDLTLVKQFDVDVILNNFMPYKHLTDIVIANDQKAFIRSYYLDEMWNTISAVFEFDLTTYNVKRVGELKATMGGLSVIEDKLYTFENNKLYVTNVEDLTTETVTFDTPITAIAEGEDDHLWVVVTGEASAALKVETESHTTVQTISASEDLVLGAGTKSAGLVVDGDDLYLNPTADFYYQSTKIYKITSAGFAELSDMAMLDDEEAGMLYGRIAYDDETETVMYTAFKDYVEYGKTALFAVDATTGKLVKKYSDVGIYPTMILELDNDED